MPLLSSSSPSAGLLVGIAVPAAAALAVAASLTTLLGSISLVRRGMPPRSADDDDDNANDDGDNVPSNHHHHHHHLNTTRTNKGGYESLIGNTPLLYLPNISSLILPNQTKIFVKMESMNPGGTGKDRAALSMILDAEGRGELPPPLERHGRMSVVDGDVDGKQNKTKSSRKQTSSEEDQQRRHDDNTNTNTNSNHIIPSNIHNAILTALSNTQTHGILIEGTSGSTGISLASISCSRGHGVIVVMPDDQSQQKVEYLKKLGVGVVVVQNCSISNPGHYVNVARRVWEWLQVERRYDDYYHHRENNNSNSNNEHNATKTPPPTPPPEQQQPKQLIQAAFMNQFENLANVQSHYTTTGPEIYSQLNGKVDAFVMSAGTGGTLVGVGGYLKERWWRDTNNNHRQQHTTKQSSSSPTTLPPKIVLVDPPGSSLHNKIKYGVAYAPQQSEQKLRRHRYDTLAEGIGLDRITANFGLGCENVVWCNGNNATFGNRIKMLMNDNHDITNGHHSTINMMTPKATATASPPPKAANYTSKIIDDSISITDQQAIHMAHYLLRHEGLFVGSSTAMNLVGAIKVASQMPNGSNVVTVVCDGGQRHTSRFWNRDFVVGEWGLVWPGDNDDNDNDTTAIVEDSSSGRGGQDGILELLGIVL